ncbi:hypothetical protein [Gordonia liuliyuniae]|uniref:Uncharacterized protein n=1 Tax=Gordonia liuliyuniae TaxID=2911517 RepID=A0ABS9INS7_9ACTN|nr:hypothetical protein [Gordonia liuliyuniae]MCF8587196.1 hypothetical protein [Gordonia liuliyuniae]
MTFYRLDYVASAHVECSGDPGVIDGSTTEFYLDYTPHREVIGRYGIYALTEPLAELVVEHGFSGCHFEAAVSLVSSHADPEIEISLPELRRLVADGVFMEDDFAEKDGDLIVSQSAYDLMVARDPEIAIYTRQLREDGTPIVRAGWSVS